MVARFQQPFCSVNAKVEMSGPGDLAGRRSRRRRRMTVTWLRESCRTIMAHLDAVKGSLEDAHVAEYSDDAGACTRARKITDMLLDGEIDVALGERIDDPRKAAAARRPRACRFRTHIVPSIMLSWS